MHADLKNIKKTIDTFHERLIAKHEWENLDMALEMNPHNFVEESELEETRRKRSKRNKRKIVVLPRISSASSSGDGRQLHSPSPEEKELIRKAYMQRCQADESFALSRGRGSKKDIFYNSWKDTYSELGVSESILNANKGKNLRTWATRKKPWTMSKKIVNAEDCEEILRQCNEFVEASGNAPDISRVKEMVKSMNKN